MIAALGRDSDPVLPDIPGSTPGPAPASLPAASIAASRFEQNPSAADLRVVLAALGGLEGLTLGVAEGSFVRVSFDPDDSSRLSASTRREMGWLERGADNEQWVVADGRVVQTPAPPVVTDDREPANGEASASSVGLDDAGHLTLTIDPTGPVSVWFEGSSVPLIEVEALGTAVSADRSTIAVKRRAWPTAEAIWQIIDVDIDSWLARARDLTRPAAELAR